jgi:hypothetical protein
MSIAPAPLFRDPIHDGAADPTIVWNRDEQAWWILYTNRRANVDCPGVAWCHGTDIGVAASADGGRTWRYRGSLPGLEWERGRNTFWAPEALWADGRYHMYVSYVPGVPHDWSGPRRIVHYTSANLWDWRRESILDLSSERVIDACVHRLPSGRWRMWYKDESNQSHIYAADSDDLCHWTVAGPVLTNRAQEGPNVFQWRGWHWMITDVWDGQDVYRSGDGENWTWVTNILRAPGRRADDGWMGSHADVLVQGDQAFLFYFTHPGRGEPIPELVPGVMPYAHRRSSLQVARLEMEDGVPACDRDRPFALELCPLEMPE